MTINFFTIKKLKGIFLRTTTQQDTHFIISLVSREGCNENWTRVKCYSPNFLKFKTPNTHVFMT